MTQRSRQLLGLGGERRRAGGAELGAGLGAELGELGGLAAGRLGVAAQAAGGGDLGAPARARGRTGPALTSSSGAVPRRLPAT